MLFRSVDSDNADYYKKNNKEFSTKLKKLKEDFAKELKKVKRKEIIVADKFPLDKHSNRILRDVAEFTIDCTNQAAATGYTAQVTLTLSRHYGDTKHLIVAKISNSCRSLGT